MRCAKSKINSADVLPKITALYERALPASRSGPLYGAFPYPTKISPEAIALFIAAHTRPGDTVFDGFAGSGTTGLAALLCENPSDELRAEADRLGLNVEWGARNAVLYEIGALGSFVGRTLSNPPEPRAFRKAAADILKSVEAACGWMYGALDPEGRQGALRHAVWSDLLTCPDCQGETSLWDSSVSLAPARIRSTFSCQMCGCEAPLDEATRSVENSWDDVIDASVERRSRTIARIYGSTGKSRWSRPASKADSELIAQIEAEPIPDCVPKQLIPWGDLYRRGYHKGITHLHQFYTRRNLIVFGRLWEAAGRYPEAIRGALRFWLLSYNAAHATIMTRVVAKSGQKDLVVTSAQPGVLYVSGLPVEKNLFAGLRRKLKTISDAFGVVYGRRGRVSVHQHSSCEVDLPDGSIDYVFTDPPFGGNIPYAEINFINEAWLGEFTDRRDEAIVSSSQKKSIREYQELLTDALSEANRILKPEGKATLVFHSASAEVWNALRGAYSDAGLGVECAGVLDKTQGSFKQVTTAGAVRGDPVLLLAKARSAAAIDEDCVWTVAERLSVSASSLGVGEQSAQRLYSRLVSHFLTRDQDIPLDADEFYRWHNARETTKASEFVSA
ncbi:MAG: DNA methylase N-4/N-6 [Sphingomonadales bacterium CG12_big_fil_rev_8_21_14_0_65_65_10]|nr:MAG: DNA methylase N-4/N-6 [Sphingomonadales bacterium CG12_big_fil_rev_8_21_14_0_65_65_10]